MVEYYRHESKLYLLFYYIARINKPKPESLVVLKILNNMKEGEGRPKLMKKGRLIEELEEELVYQIA